MTDVTLKLPDHSTIRCHKVILMAASPFFETMFQSGMKEGVDRVVRLKFSDSVTIKMLVDFIYSGEIDVDGDNVQTIVAASEFLLLKDLKTHCEKFLADKVNSSNCIQLIKFCQRFNLEKLNEIAQRCIRLNFQEVVALPEFKTLTEEDVTALVSNDQLKVANEDIVYHAVVAWVKADPKNRKGSFLRIAPLIRFAHCTQETLNGVVGREPLMWNPECMELLTEAQ
ncbi:hypothetical protein CAPTEDRAFT_144920, partial [Capitella teleta]